MRGKNMIGHHLDRHCKLSEVCVKARINHKISRHGTLLDVCVKNRKNRWRKIHFLFLYHRTSWEGVLDLSEDYKIYK
jgi:hypothetical protein